LQAVAPWDEETLRQGLQQLVGAEFLYQRGLPPQATSRFKHALIQDAAYQSLLRSTRQQYHQRIAQVVEARFPELCETQPELLAHHYTEVGLSAQAIPYWQRAGEHTLQRSANLEAISHVTKGLAVLSTLPETRERAQQELGLQITLGPALYGFWYAQMATGQLPWAWELGEEFLGLAQQQQDPLLLVEGHRMLGNTAWWQGELTQTHAHVQAALALYDPEQHRVHAVRYSADSGVFCAVLGALTLWMLGYPDQALRDMEETRTRRLGHPFTLAQALAFSALLHQLRCEPQVALAQAEAQRALCTERGFATYLAWGMMPRGWALAVQGQVVEGIAQLREGFATWRALGGERVPAWPWFLALWAEACSHAGQLGEGLCALDEVLRRVQHKEERLYEAEVYRLKGELLLQGLATRQEEAEESFQHALDVACRQQAKSWELRAAMSLSRLWQQQGKRAEARALLAPIYGWFTEGFDTADLQEANALLEELS
jgi:predicted ATPase